MDSINRLRQAADELAQRAMPCSNAPDYADVQWKVHQLADAIECEVRERYVALPLDADGVPIHVGDMMERGESRGHVIALMISEYPKKWGGELHWGVQLEGEQAPTALDLTFRHYHAPTVEDVLREFAKRWDDPANYAKGELVEAFAAKLRLSEDNSSLYELERDE